MNSNTSLSISNFVKHYLYTIFTLRPCWSKKQIIDLCLQCFKWKYSPQMKQSYQDMSHTINSYIKSFLPYIAYLYTSGPWRNLYIQFQYNPSKPEIFPHNFKVPSVLQTITLKINPQEYQNILQRLVSKISY